MQVSTLKTIARDANPASIGNPADSIVVYSVLYRLRELWIVDTSQRSTANELLTAVVAAIRRLAGAPSTAPDNTAQCAGSVGWARRGRGRGG